MAVSIFTIAPSGGDYTSLSAGASANAENLPVTGNTHIYEIESFSGGLNDNTAFSGYDADATNQLIVRNATGHEHNGQRETGAYFDQGGGSTGVMRPISGCRLTFYGLGFNNCTSPHDGNGGTLFDGHDLVISDSVGDGISPSDAQGDWYNIVVINAGDDGLFMNASGTTLTNATIIGSSNRGVYGGILKNIISVDNTGDDYASTASQTDCIASDTTGTIDNANVYDDATKGSSSSGDVIFQESALASFDGNLVDHVNNVALDAGTDSGAPDNDIAGNPFSNPPSIGAFELAGSGAIALVVDAITHGHLIDNAVLSGDFPTPDMKVQHVSKDVSSAGATDTTFDEVGSLAATIEMPANNRRTHGGNTGSTGNQEGNDMDGSTVLTATDTLTYTRDGSALGNARFETDIIEYIGAAAGDNEFIVRGRYVKALNGTTNTGTIDITSDGVVNEDNCIPIITGVRNNAGADDADSETAIAWLSDDNTIQVEKGSNTNNVSVYIVLVEFTGANWTVLHGLTTGGAADSGSITLYDGADFAGTATNVSAWAEAVIFGQYRGAQTSNVDDAISDLYPIYRPAGGLQTVDYEFNSNHANAANEKHVVHVLNNSDIVVTRYNPTPVSAAQGETTIDITSAGLTSLEQAFIVGFSISSGTGTAYGRGWRNYYLNSLTQAAHWCHRSGNTMEHELQVVDFAGLVTAAGSTPLTVQEMLHGHMIDSAALLQHGALAVSAINHNHTIDNIDLTHHAALIVADLLHGQSIDNIALVQAYMLAVADLLHSHGVDGPINLTQAHVLAVAALVHGHTIDAAVLSQHNALVISDIFHGHTIDNIDLTQAIGLAVDALLHGHTIDNIDISENPSLVVADLLHGFAIDDVSLTQAHVLAVADILHAHTIDNVDLIQAHLLAVQDLTHGHTIDEAILLQAHLLQVAELSHNHYIDEPTLTIQGALAVQNLLHGHTIDAAALAQHNALVVDDLLHGHTIDNIDLIQAHALVVSDILHGHTIDEVSLTQAHVLAVADLLHGHFVDNIGLTQNQQLAVQNLLHGHAVDEVALMQAHLLAVDALLHGHAIDTAALTQNNVLLIDDVLHAHTIEAVLLALPVVASARRTHKPDNRLDCGAAGNNRIFTPSARTGHEVDESRRRVVVNNPNRNKTI